VTARRAGITRALGGPEARRRRHRRVAIVVVVVLFVAGWLIIAGGDDSGDDGFASAAADVCESYSDQIQEEFQLSFPEGPPSAEAEAEYLSHAFVDTLDQLVVDLRALEPTGDAADAVDALAGVSEQLRSDPSTGLDVDPFAAEVRQAFDDAGIEECGSGFLAAPE
jgi:hypothetical protein